MRSRTSGQKGVSVEAIRAIERGERETVQASTARGLETGLDWPPGHVDRILEGAPLEPVPVHNNGSDEFTRRLARMEQLMGITPMSDRDALQLLLGFLTDDQFRLVADAVQADPRFELLAG